MKTHITHKTKKVKILNHNILLFSLLFTLYSYAQKNNNIKLSLKEAIEYGLSNNGSIKSADFEIERLETLKKTAYNFNKTNLDFQYGNYNGFENDFSFAISQDFQFPTVYSNQKKLAKANIEVGKSEKIIAQNNLIKEIKKTWYTLVYLKETEKLLNYKDSIYKNFLKASKIRYKVEEGTLLEKVTAETKVTAIKVELAQNKANIKIEKKKLQTLLGSQNEIDISKDYLQKKELNLNINTLKIDSNPNLKLLKKQIITNEKEINLNKAKMLPDFTLGYENQSFIGEHTINGTNRYYGAEKRFSSVMATISIPIWIKPDKAKIKASKLQKQKAEENAKYYQNLLQSEYQRVMQNYLKYKNAVEFYENKALPQAELILSNSKKSFENDAIGYVEYIQGLDTGIEIKNNYLNLINQYNQSIIAIEHLVGNKL